MGIRTIYKCDLCGAEQDSSAQFFRVGMLTCDLSSDMNQRLMPYVEGNNRVDCCRSCLELKLGMLVRKQTTELPEYKEQTIEERLIALCQAIKDTGSLS